MADILIVDSGSTKTHWLKINSNKQEQHYSSIGINPYFDSIETIEKELKQVKANMQLSGTETIYYYGTGCGSTENKQIIANCFLKILPHSTVQVEHDMLAAARALCGTEAGIACILGTGSNSCFAQAGQIIHNHPSLGFTLGDEGSGAYLGKNLLIDFAYGKVPQHLARQLVEKYELSLNTILEKIYKQAKPNRYAASFVPFIAANRHTEYMQKLISKSLNSFVQNHILAYSNAAQVPIHFTGSVAEVFKKELSDVLVQNQLQLGLIEASPMPGLSRFHKK